jgi:hypothetical protein
MFGCKLTRLFWCAHSQILYLDNVDFGSSSVVHLDIPRGNVYNNNYLRHLIDMDRKQYIGSSVV